MRRSRVSLVALALSAGLLASPARADMATFIASTCGAGCADPVGEEAAARSNWTALQSMGTTQYVGANYGSITLDPSSLLGAARVAGAMELNTYLTTGQTSDPSVASLIQQALASTTGIDLSSITGSLSGGRGSALTTAASSIGASALSSLASGSGLGNISTYGPGLGGNSGLCDNSIASAQNASAQQYINNMVKISTSGEYGFSQLGGSAVSGGQRSQNGFYGSSCLQNLLQGNRDLLFKPPQLSSLLSMLTSMFGGGSSGCNNAPSVLTQIQQSMPSGIFANSGAGGFFPYLGFGAGEGAENDLSFSNGFNLLSAVPRARTPGGSIAELFSR